MQAVRGKKIGRRTFLGMAATLAAGGLLLRQGSDPSCAAAAPATTTNDAIKHNVWVWRFDVDGPIDQVRETLAAHGVGIMLKTHEGDSWMSRFDKSGTAITGPQRVREMAEYFESAGVPFHAWCVVQGLDPMAEAQLCSDVLNNGARSLTFDLEPSDGGHYWQGTPQAALAFGQELRRLQPNARLAVAPDGRPWQIAAVPTAEFATFCNEILPQTYWQTFNGKTNNRLMAESGYPVGAEGMTPELILEASAGYLSRFGLPVRPIGQGTAGYQEWERFIRRAYELGMDSVSVWRYGTASSEVWPALVAMAPPQPAPAAPPVAATEPPPEPTAAAEEPVAAAAPTEVPPTEVPATPEPTSEVPQAQVAGVIATDQSCD